VEGDAQAGPAGEGVPYRHVVGTGEGEVPGKGEGEVAVLGTAAV
jgi:hypothetical protein